MNRERWAVIKDLFDRLVSVPPDEQERALEALDQDRSGLGSDVRRLLAHARRTSVGVLDGHAADLLADDGPDPETLGRFTIRGRLGAGGMGVVYDAFDPLRSTRVALKALTRVTPASISLFKHEFRSLAGVHHPHLVTLYDLFEADERWFFTMEFVDGEPLGAHLSAATDRWTSTRRVVLALAEGLDALHQADKLHRDLKPGNVMVTRDGRVVILDFGLVADVGAGASTGGAFAGTPRYMSPEQAAGRPLTTASDAYALGVVLFEALTGLLPPPASQRQETEEEIAVTMSAYGPVPDDLSQLCVDLLREAPEARPSMAAVADLLRPAGATHHATLARAVAGDRRLIGRDVELRALDAAALAAASGPVVVSVEGESGVGKTALVNHWLSTVRRQPNVLVLASRCYESESISFNIFDSLSDALSANLRGQDAATLERLRPNDAGAIGRLFPRLSWLGDGLPRPSAVDRQQLRRSARRAFRELLCNLSERVRLVVSVDDVQWADQDSVELLIELLRDPAAPRLLIILGCRAERRRRSAALELLATELSQAPAVVVETLALRPLGTDDATAVAASLLSTFDLVAPRDQVEWIAHESGGIPFFIGELVQFAQRSGDGETAASGDQVTLASVIQARAQQLPAPARRLLETVALAGRPLRSVDALTAALEEDRSPTWLALLRSDRFVRTVSGKDGEFVEPFHDRLRETIVAGLAPIDRRSRHLALATTLERSSSPDVEILAVHFEEAGEAGRAGRYYASAARQAAALLAFKSAADRFDKALALGTWTADDRLDMVRARAEVLAHAGRAFEAAQSYRAAGDEDSPDGLGSMSRAGYHFAASGRIADAKQAFAAVNTRLRIRLPLESRLVLPRLLALKGWLSLRRYRFQPVDRDRIPPIDLARIDACWFVGAGLGLVELLTGALFTTYALHLALKAGDAFRVARGLTWEAAIAASQSRGGKRQAAVLFDICRDLVERLQDPYCTAMLSMCEGLADFSHGRWVSARDRLARAEQLFTRECVGVSYELATLNGFKLQTCVYAGAYRELRTLTPDLLEAARAASDLYTETFIRGAILPLLHLADDRSDLARESVTAALTAWTSPGYHLQHALIDQVRLCIELYDGKADDAVTLVNRQWLLLNRAGLLFNQNLRAKLLELRAKCVVASASSSRGTHAANIAIRRLEREREPSWAGSALSLRAILARGRGRHAEAETILGRGLAAYEQESMSDYAAAAAYRLAAWRSDSAALTEAGERLRAESIQDPARWSRMRIPVPVS